MEGKARDVQPEDVGPHRGGESGGQDSVSRVSGHHMGKEMYNRQKVYLKDKNGSSVWLGRWGERAVH